ncbi:MAG TPA: molybdate ABC transporter substrate-binding protein [Halomicronema sp.]
MKKLYYLLLSIGTFVLCLWMASCSPPPSQLISLNVGAAGMVRGSLEEINDIYQKEKPNVVVNYTFAGGGTLQSAIKRGEPFDLLLLAAVGPMDKLQADGLIVPESRRNLVTTDVVLIVPATSKLSINDFKDLTSERVQKIAIGTSRTAIGNYSKEILTNLGIYKQVQPKAVWANLDVREVLRAVENNEVDAGITFLPEAKLSSAVKVAAVASADSYRSITAVGAILKRSTEIPEASAFLNFLTSPQAVAVFEHYGIKLLR